MKKQVLALAAALIAAPGLTAAAQTGSWTIDPMHSQAGFEIRHMGVSNVHGVISGITGTVVIDPKNPAKDSVVTDLDATTLTTNVEPRDKHLKSPDFFNVAQFPKLHFQSTGVKKVNGKLVVTGDLTLTGITRPVVLEVTEGPSAPQKGMQGGLATGLTATTTLKRADFNFGPKFAPPILGDEVKITIELELDQK